MNVVENCDRSLSMIHELPVAGDRPVLKVIRRGAFRYGPDEWRYGADQTDSPSESDLENAARLLEENAARNREENAAGSGSSLPTNYHRNVTASP